MFTSSYFALKLGYINKTHAHIHKVELKTLFHVCLTITELFSPFYLVEMKVLSFSSTVNQVIMRVHKPKVEYKLALQEKPKGAP